MKFTATLATVVGLSALLLTSGCGGKSIQQRIDDARREAQSERDASEDGSTTIAPSDDNDELVVYRAAAERQLAADAKLLEAAGSRTAALDALLEEHRALSQRLERYTDEGRVGWDAFRRDFTNDLERFDKSVHALSAAGKN